MLAGGDEHRRLPAEEEVVGIGGMEINGFVSQFNCLGMHRGGCKHERPCGANYYAGSGIMPGTHKFNLAIGRALRIGNYHANRSRPHVSSLVLESAEAGPWCADWQRRRP